MMGMTDELTWANVLGEAEFAKMLGKGKSGLASLRAKGLPCRYLNATTRIYVDRDVLAWAAAQARPQTGLKVAKSGNTVKENRNTAE